MGLVVQARALFFFWRHDTQHNDIRPKDTQHKGLISDNEHNGIQHNETQHNDTQYKGLIIDIEHIDTQHNDTQHNETLPLC